MEDEIRDIVGEEIPKHVKDVVFPELQDVHVTNWPELRDPIVNVTVPDFPTIPAPIVNVPKANITVTPPEVTVNVPDFPVIPETVIDLSKLEEGQDETNDLLEEIKKGVNKPTNSGGTPNVLAVVDAIDTTVGKVSATNNSTTPLASGATFTGTAEMNNAPDVMVSCFSDTAGTLYFDFSVNGVDWRTFPTAGFTVSAGIHEFHTAVKGPRYFRVRFVNSASTQSTFQLSTYFGTFRQSNAPLNQAINDDSDASIVRAIATGKQPDGDYVNQPSDGLAFETSTPLGIAETFTSGWYDTDGYTTVELFVATDVKSDQQGVKIDFTDDTQAGTPTVRATKSYSFGQADVDRGYMELHIPTSLDGFRLRYINDGVAQSTFYLSTTLRVNTDNFVFNAGGALVQANFLTEVALGNISNYTVDTKFGRNPEIDTTSDPEDVWNGGGLYTGHPVSFTPETVDVFSSDANDTSAGTGARTVRIYGLQSSASTEYTTEDITLNGLTAVTSTNTWWRINRVEVLTAGSGGENAGTVTVRATTTTAVVFAAVPIGFNQSAIAAFTAPAGQKMLVQQIGVSLSRLSGAAGSAVVSFRVRPPGGVYNSKRIYSVQTGSRVQDLQPGGISVEPGSDMLFRVDSVSDNDTTAEASFEYILLEQT